MKKIAWLKDIHFNFLDNSVIIRFCEEIVAKDPDAVVITGDIGEADSVERYLSILQDNLKRPIYFVLGNHD